MRGYHFCEVALFTGTSPENMVADFYNSTGYERLPVLSRISIVIRRNSSGLLVGTRLGTVKAVRKMDPTDRIR
jgi:hypothetical protein